jgi:hypothetical protein
MHCAVAFPILRPRPAADLQGMTYTPAPEFIQSTVAISNSRKDLLASALHDALHSVLATEKRPWEPYIETPDQQHANARAQRLAWLVDSLVA